MQKRLSIRALFLRFAILAAIVAVLVLAFYPDDAVQRQQPPQTAEAPKAGSLPGPMADTEGGQLGASEKSPETPVAAALQVAGAPDSVVPQADPSTAPPSPTSGPPPAAAEIVGLLDGPGPLTANAELFRSALKDYYGARGGAPLWQDPTRMTALIERLARAEEDGLNPSHYPLSNLVSRLQSVDTADAAVRAENELAFGATFLSYASDLKVGRLKPRTLTPELVAEVKTIDGEAVLAAFAAAPDLGTFLAGWAPHNPEYRALRVLLSEYRKIASAGGWAMVPAGETLKPGMRGDRVGRVRARLEATGDITIVGGDAEFYDPALQMAVERFQKRHGLDGDGVVGNKTLAALNVPVTDRIQQIILNMERWRWLPEDLGNRYILVNIAGFELTLVEAGAVVERMAVVVGRPYRQTPVFSDRVRYLEFNPYWSVPFKLAGEDELPKIKKDPAFIAEHGFEVFLQDKPVDPATVDWSKYTKRTFPFTLRQKPGPDNALGRVKFMFPNEFDVYLHDTPSRDLFGHATRAFSSGCIRLERPLELAVRLLDGTPGWDRERIDALIASERNTRIDLAEPVPIHLTYSTAWSGEGGTINFRPDIYDRDKRLHEALFGK